MAYRWFFRVLLVQVTVSVLALLVPWIPVVVPLLVLGVLLLCAGAAIAIIGFPRHAETRAGGWAWWVGAVWIIGAIAADVGVTVWKSPGLEAEANLFAAVLLDEAKLAVAQVYLLGGIAQLAIATLMVGIWRNLVARHAWYANWLRLARAQGRPLWAAMFGMRDATWTSWLGKGARLDVATAAFGFYMPAIAAYRLYLAMEWLGWAPYSRVLMPALLLVGAGVVHAAWVYCRSQDEVPAMSAGRQD